jgi:hypothetical protein
LELHSGTPGVEEHGAREAPTHTGLQASRRRPTRLAVRHIEEHTRRRWRCHPVQPRTARRMLWRSRSEHDGCGPSGGLRGATYERLTHFPAGDLGEAGTELTRRQCFEMDEVLNFKDLVLLKLGQRLAENTLVHVSLSPEPQGQLHAARRPPRADARRRQSRADEPEEAASPDTYYFS